MKQPRYQQIAIDIASRVARNDLSQGQRLSGRSVLSSEYGVSPETIRRAVKLLEEVGVVNVATNYGVIIKSKEKALVYLQSISDVNDVSQLRRRLNELKERRSKIDKEIDVTIDKIIDLTNRFSFSDPQTKYEFIIGIDSDLIGKTLRTSSFYQTTHMTITAIRRGNQTFLSPGPDVLFEEGDVLSVIGDVRDVEHAEEVIEGETSE